MTTAHHYEWFERLPTTEEHASLWEAVGWGNVNTEMTAASLAHSVYGMVVVQDDKVIGMGRIVGDGHMYFYIQDVAVLPQFQGQGIGNVIIEQLLRYIRSHSFTGAFVGLFASHANNTFYERYGFQNHAPGMTGMFKVME
ncbi:ribosomal protein S18 acetylase RimI-like enzyme [Paenibacillus sp. PastF-3]|uniref:GNAT family N-acetyltransferase n=1 Tax=unclassified Paenibacillus TaxID=185978 RepID=UPI000BA14691|nr:MULTISPECIES: GNAT family N-acetyltransferase [unclassified Paenibacillus]MDH6374226.1 ribosomal protein S18 acetylase RimI-like enzyme [Paenibacillus sp. PastF-3]OZQ90540.1 GNAT family N-acetyltransferase [Paenibacillus sp. VTT E-133291]